MATLSSPASDAPHSSGASQTASLVPPAWSPPSQCPVPSSGLESTEGTGTARVTHKALVQHLCAAWHAGFTSAVWVSVIFFSLLRETVCRPGQNNLIKSLINSLAEAAGNLRRPGHKGEPGICSDCTEQQQLSAHGHQVGKAIWTSLLLAATCRELQMGVGIAEPKRRSGVVASEGKLGGVGDAWL